MIVRERVFLRQKECEKLKTHALGIFRNGKKILDLPTYYLDIDESELT